MFNRVPDSDHIQRKLSELRSRIQQTQESIAKARERIDPDKTKKKPRKKKT
jgi:hypothetical protein